MRSSLTPLWVQTPRPHQAQAQQQSASVVRFKEPDPTPVVPVQPRVDIEYLTAADVRELSTATINALLPYNRKVVAQAIVDAGRRRRGELATPMTSLKPMPHAILLAGMKRRAEKISDADKIFLREYLGEIEAS